LQERIAANLAKIQGLEMRAYTLEEEQQQQQDNEQPNVVGELVAAKDQRIAQLEAELAAVVKKQAAAAANCGGDSSGLVKRLQAALKSQKELLRVREEEIGVLRKQLLSGQEDSDLLLIGGGGDSGE
jgi:hypothetical protein